MTQRSDGADAVEAGLDADLDAAPPADTPSEPPAHSRPAPLRRRRVLLAALAAGVAVAAAVAVREAGDRGGQSALDGSATAEELFPVLASPPRPGSQALDPVMSANVGALAGSERRLAVTPTATFWVARDHADGVCLLVRNSDDELGYGGVCTLAAAAAQGVELPPGGGPSAVLVPARFDTAGLARRGYVELGSGLWVDGRTAASAGIAAVR